MRSRRPRKVRAPRSIPEKTATTPRHADILELVVATETGCILPEFTVGNKCIDLAVFDKKEIRGYEFKSDVDTLKRLRSQNARYVTIFTKLTYVVGPKHIAEVMEIVPAWTGIIMVDEEGLHIVRTSKKNPAPAKISIARMLWKTELTEVFKARGCWYKTPKECHSSCYKRVRCSNMTAKCSGELSKILSDSTPTNELVKVVCEAISHRVWGRMAGRDRRVIRQ